jgi:hypothetical protein
MQDPGGTKSACSDRHGESFQRFLLDNCRIHYVIEFDRAVFPDA